MIYDQAITIVTPGTKTSRSGDEIPDWDPDVATERTISGVSVQPALQAEPDGQVRDVTITGMRVITDDGIDVQIQPNERIRFEGLLYEVDGEIARWPDPVGVGVDHCEFNLKRVEG